MVDPLVAAPAAVSAGIGVVGLALRIIRPDGSVDKIDVRGFG